MTMDIIEGSGRNPVQEKRVYNDHLKMIAQIREGGEFVENDLEGFDQTEDGLWIDADGTVWRQERSERNFGKYAQGSRKLAILAGDRHMGWLCELSRQELDDLRVRHTIQELQAREHASWREATSKAIAKAKKIPAIPKQSGPGRTSFGSPMAGSVRWVEERMAEYGLVIRTDKATGVRIVQMPTPKIDEKKMGPIGVGRIHAIPDEASAVYYELAKLGRAYGSNCDIPGCKEPGETLRVEIVLCEHHAA